MAQKTPPMINKKKDVQKENQKENQKVRRGRQTSKIKGMELRVVGIL